jgi:vacuolar-type H+-ATPase subunit I/STV1
MGVADSDEEKRVTTGEAGAAGGARAKPPAREALGTENISKVRDILVGPQLRETEKRLSRLEQRLTSEVTRIWGEATKRFDSVESYMRKDADAFSGQLAREQGDRAESLKEVSQKLQDANSAIQRLREELASVQRQIQQQLLDQATALRDESRQQNEAISAALDRAVEELRAEKTDRVALAALFAEVSARLTENLEIGFGDRSEE